MPRFFADENAVCGDIITVTGSDARHIGYSLRMKVGDMITFCREGMEYSCEISQMTADKVICQVIEVTPSDCEPTIILKLYQALPKGDKMELIIQKAAELGVGEIVPFVSSRCVSRPDEASAMKKLARWRKISLEAAKQSGRGKVPAVAPIVTFEEAIDGMSSDIKLICYENEGIRLSEAGIDGKKSVSVMIGSEGGFERAEVEKAKAKGITPIWLGKRILRCETCPIAVSAVIMNLSGNW